MSNPYDAIAVALSTLTLPADGDLRNVASVNGPIKALANAIKFLSGAGTLRFDDVLVNEDWIVPPGCDAVLWQLVAGGGGGGGGADNPGATGWGAGGGGGGGAPPLWFAAPTTPGETITHVIGVGGQGGSHAAIGIGGSPSEIKRGATIVASAFGGGPGYPGSTTHNVDTNYTWGIGGSPTVTIVNAIPNDPFGIDLSSDSFLHFMNTIMPQQGMHGLTGNHPWHIHRVRGGPSPACIGGRSGLGSNTTSGIYRGGGGGGGGGGGMFGAGADGGAGSAIPAATSASNGAPGVAAEDNSGAGGGGGGGAAGSTSGAVIGGAGGNGGSGRIRRLYVKTQV